MRNKEMLEELIERSSKVEATFPTQNERGVRIASSMATSKDIKQLSQWVNEAIIVLDRLSVLKNDLICNEFKLVYNNIENIRLNKFQALVGALKAILNKYHLEENTQKNQVDFQDEMNKF